MCKINVNFNRKVSDNNYGSRGAGVSFEFEVDTAQTINAEQIQDRIRKAFRLAQQAVDAELARYQAGTASTAGTAAHASTGASNSQAAQRAKQVADRVPGVAVASEPAGKAAMVLITGNSFAVKDQLKALGGRWDKAAKAWRVPAAKAAQAKALVAAA